MYLIEAILNGAQCRNGSVPSAYHPPIFELIWCLATYFGTGFLPSTWSIWTKFSVPMKRSFSRLKCYSLPNGPLYSLVIRIRLLMDVKSQAPWATPITQLESIVILAFLGSSDDPSRLLHRSPIRNRFMTYFCKSNPSLSANCNIDNYLSAHGKQLSGNAQSASPISEASTSHRRTLFDWIHVTSSQYTSCHLAFLFWLCLLDGDVGSFNSRAEDIAHALCQHLAALCCNVRWLRLIPEWWWGR